MHTFMRTHDPLMYLKAQPELDHILISLGYAVRSQLGDSETFKAREENDSLDQFLQDQGLQPAMIGRKARAMRAILLGQSKVPEEGLLFGGLTDPAQLFMAIVCEAPPGFALIFVQAQSPSQGTTSP